MLKRSYNIKDYTINSFQIDYSQSNGYYICSRVPDISDDVWSYSVYMHKDGTLHDFCGSKNFFKTRKLAYNVLKDVFTVKLPEELFEI